MYEPRDANIMEVVSSHAKTKGIEGFWLGILDMNKKGIFVYTSDNSPIKFDNWAFGKPHNGGGCAYVLASEHGVWIDFPCKHPLKRSIVCVRDKPSKLW